MSQTQTDLQTPTQTDMDTRKLISEMMQAHGRLKKVSQAFDDELDAERKAAAEAAAATAPPLKLWFPDYTFKGEDMSPAAPIRSAMHVAYERSMLAPDRPVVLVVGASRGIGICICNDLIKLGGHLMAVSRDFQTLQTLRETYPDQVDFACIDLTLPNAAQVVIASTIRRWGRIDGMIVNHSVLTPMKRVVNCDMQDWMNVMENNFFSVVRLCKQVIPELRPILGRIIFVSSYATRNAVAAWGPYSASKAALEQLSRTIAVEEPRIRCLSVSLDAVNTAMYDVIPKEGGEMDQEQRDKLVKARQQGSLIRPALVAAIVMRLSIWATREMSGKHYNWGDPQLAKFQTGEDWAREWRVLTEEDPPKYPRTELGHSTKPRW
ncbi:hypothetical protein QBC44DRAFT_317099 [Cladorrhinum sp. PSN332]|nr:hypothetical protein QBC44DRAFT_317099 [Cladorrhinum sp. PSN332]